MRAGIEYYRKAFARVDSGEAYPVYLLKGEELFIMEEMASRIITRHVQEDMRSFNLSIDYGSDIDMKTFVSTARSFPFLSDRRVMVVRELERLKGRWKQLIECCADPADSTIIVMICSTHDDRGRRIKPHRDLTLLEKKVRSIGQSISFDRLDDDGLRKWIKSRAGKMDMEMNEEAVSSLLSITGSNLYDLQNEIEKLSIAFEGEKVSGRDIADVIGSYRIRGVLEMLTYIGRGNKALTLEVLSGIINSGAERPSVVVYQLIRHFLALLRIKAGQGGNGYRYKRLKAEAGRLETRKILTWLENLRTTEILMKSTAFPEELILDGVILNSMDGRLMERDYWRVGAA